MIANTTLIRGHPSGSAHDIAICAKKHVPSPDCWWESYDFQIALQTSKALPPLGRGLPRPLLCLLQTLQGVAAPTTAVGVTTMADVEKARLGLVVAPDPVRELASEEAAGQVVAAAVEDGGSAREAARMDMTRRPRPDRLRAHARVTVA